MCDSYKINVNLFPTFSYFYLHSAFSRACNRFANRRSRITGSLHTLLSRLFARYPRAHPRLSDCFHATVPPSAYVGFKCHFSASAHPVVWFAVCQMPSRDFRLFHELGGRCGIRTRDVLRSSPPSLAVYPFAFTTQPTFLSSFYIFSKFIILILNFNNIMLFMFPKYTFLAY